MSVSISSKNSMPTIEVAKKFYNEALEKVYNGSSTERYDTLRTCFSSSPIHQSIKIGQIFETCILLERSFSDAWDQVVAATTPTEYKGFGRVVQQIPQELVVLPQPLDIDEGEMADVDDDYELDPLDSESETERDIRSYERHYSPVSEEDEFIDRISGRSILNGREYPVFNGLERGYEIVFDNPKVSESDKRELEVVSKAEKEIPSYDRPLSPASEEGYQLEPYDPESETERDIRSYDRPLSPAPEEGYQLDPYDPESETERDIRSYDRPLSPLSEDQSD